MSPPIRPRSNPSMPSPTELVAQGYRMQGQPSASLSESLLWVTATLQQSVIAHEDMHRRLDEEAKARSSRNWAGITLLVAIVGPFSGWYGATHSGNREPPVQPPTASNFDERGAEYVTAQPRDNACKIAARYGRDVNALIVKNSLPLIQRGKYIDAPCKPGQKFVLPERGARAPRRVTC